MGNQEKKKRGKKARSRAARLAVWFLLIGALGVVGAGCGDSGGSSGKECESSEECGEGYWCNPATNRCEARDGDGGMGDDGDVDGEVDGEVLECENSGECTEATAPICDETSQECRGCEEGSGECAADYPDRPLCDGDSGACVACLISVDDCTEATAPICDETSQLCRDCDVDAECEARGEGLEACDNVSGECVECTDSALHCGGAMEPVCDSATQECRGCESHAECDHVGGLCEFSTGMCMDASSVVHVDCVATTNGDGSAGSPYNVLQDAVDAVGGGAGPYVLVEGSCEPVEVIGLAAIYIYGKGGAEVVTEDASAALYILYAQGDPDGVVEVNGMALRGGAGHDGDVVACSNSGSGVATVKLAGVEVEDSDNEGVTTSGCDLELQASTVSGSGGIGVSVSGGAMTMEGSTVSGSGGIGVSVSGGDVEMKGNEVVLNNGGGVAFSTGNGVFWNNMIVRNGSSGSTFGGVQLQAGSGNIVSMWNNTIANNLMDTTAVPSIGGVFCGMLGTVELTNTIVEGNSGEQSNTNCSYESSFITDGSGTLMGVDNITTGTPEFLGGGDFHLQGTSPCIDQGTSTGMPAGLITDYDGENRVQGGGVDMGADEAQ